MLVNLAVTWLPYGGPPPEEIWIRFGLHPDQYWRRLCYLLALGSWRRQLDRETGEQIRTLAQAGLHPTRHRPHPTPANEQCRPGTRAAPGGPTIPATKG